MVLHPEFAGAPIDRADVAVIAVHGREQSPEVITELLVDPVVAALGRHAERVAWVLPRAAGGVWYPERFSDVTHADPNVRQALDALSWAAAFTAPVAPTTVVWAGFSQGACLVCEFVARSSVDWGGVAAFAGARFGPPGTDHTIDRSLSGLRACFGVGAEDSWAPLDAVIDTARAFARAGARTSLDVEPTSVHTVHSVDVERTAGLIADLLAG